MRFMTESRGPSWRSLIVTRSTLICSPIEEQVSYRNHETSAVKISGLQFVWRLMEVEQRGAKAGCSVKADNLMMDRMVTLDCHRGNRNLSMAWVDVRKAYDWSSYLVG